MHDIVGEDEAAMASVDMDSKFMQNVVAGPSEECPDDFCKALDYSGTTTQRALA